MVTEAYAPKLWRAVGEERSASTDAIRSSVEDYTFGMKALIVDFFRPHLYSQVRSVERNLRR
jgi:hypothetical protein